MSAHQKYSCLWAVPLPPSADAPEGPVDVTGAADFDTYEAADWHARYQAERGPRPDWWAVIEKRLKHSRSVCFADEWIVTQQWESGQAVLELNRPDFEYLYTTKAEAA